MPVSDPPITLEPAAGDDLDRVVDLLEANDLPTADVGTGTGRFFLASAEGEFIGVGGLEDHGAAGLLRSVVVVDDARGEGLGTELCAALEARAREADLEALYLLTTTAAGFFRRCGYEELPREAVPSAIEATTEFGELCPASATCMYKEL